MLNCRILREKLLQIKQNTVENELNKLKTFDSSYFIGKNHFEDGTKNYLVFQPIVRYFKLIVNNDYILSWKSKGLSAESIKPPTTSDNSLTPRLNYYGDKVSKIYWKLFKTTNNFVFS